MARADTPPSPPASAPSRLRRADAWCRAAFRAAAWFAVALAASVLLSLVWALTTSAEDAPATGALFRA